MHLNDAAKFVMEGNFVAAVKIYQKLIDPPAIVGLSRTASQHISQLLNRTDISANDLNAIGVMYYNGDGIRRDFSNASKWYKKAIEQGSAVAHRNLGLLYEFGLGVPQNIIVAVKHYQQAIEKGYLAAGEDLNKLELAPTLNNISSDDLNTIGMMYHNGDYINRDRFKALRWYKKAIEKGNALAHRNLGLLYEDGIMVKFSRGSQNSLINMAAKYYQQAIEKGYEEAQKDLDRLFMNVNIADSVKIGLMYHKGNDVTKDFAKAKKWYEGPNKGNIPYVKKYLKNLERDWLIEQSKRSFYFLEERDSENNTALHRAAKYQHLKNCARLLFLGANKETYNAEIKKPLQYLSSTDQQKVTKLHNSLSSLINHLEAKTPDLILGRMFVDHGSFNKAKSLQTLNYLYQINEIKPLMDLSKLAVLGLHDLSKREKFTRNDYDSDNDDEESTKEDQQFTIRIDATETTVQNICHYGADGQEGKNACGLYRPQGNTIYVGGHKTTAEVRATKIHEMTHFVTDEVFKNASNPYASNDLTNKRLFEAIVNDLEKRQYMLDPILTQVFSLYKKTEYHSEFIVRVPQMIVQYPDGIKRLENQAPRLLDYYKNTFLIAVQNHTNELEKRALGDWPLKLFKRDRYRDYSFQINPDYMDTSTPLPDNQTESMIFEY